MREEQLRAELENVRADYQFLQMGFDACDARVKELEAERDRLLWTKNALKLTIESAIAHLENDRYITHVENALSVLREGLEDD